MKLNILKIFLFSIITTLTSCNDFFNVETDDVLDGKDYIAADNEMYAGYVGIMTKVQRIGDKVIYLTDTRGELLEPTINASGDLYGLYNYEEDLTGNSYADPAEYYDVIIACNDYISKMYAYKKLHSSSINKTHFEALISCTLRVKAWIYLTLGKVYGEAVWFDDPMIEKKDLSQFPVKNLDEIVVSCKQLLDTGVEGVDGTLTMSWKEWVDPNTATGDSNYRYWDYMTPDYVALYAELCLWSGEYQKAADLILKDLNSRFAGTVNDATSCLRNITLDGNYKTIWNSISPYPREVVSAIIYDYTKNQTNSLLKHFGTEYPNEYLLAPSEAGRNRFADPEFNNLGGKAADTRAGVTFRKDNAERWVVQKFRPLTSPTRTYSYQDDVPVYIYRGSELHFMLAEAMNHLGRYEVTSALINKGIGGTFPNGNVTWEGFTDDWTSKTPTGNRTYPNAGIRGTFALGERTFSKDALENDLALLDEMLLEFPCEGKIYPAMIRIAKRHGDYNIIADRVCAKYSDPEAIRAKILAGGYFLKWNLKNK